MICRLISFTYDENRNRRKLLYQIFKENFESLGIADITRCNIREMERLAEYIFEKQYNFQNCSAKMSYDRKQDFMCLIIYNSLEQDVSERGDFIILDKFEYPYELAEDEADEYEAEEYEAEYEAEDEAEDEADEYEAENETIILDEDMYY